MSYLTGYTQMLLNSSGLALIDVAGNNQFKFYEKGMFELGVDAFQFIPLQLPAGACTAGTPTAGGAVNDGLHSYRVTFVTPDGETDATMSSGQVTTGGGNNTVPLTDIPVGNSRVTARKIYRTIAGDVGNHLLLATINDNTTTTYSDTMADAALGAAAPTTNTTTNVFRSFCSDVPGGSQFVWDTNGSISNASLFQFKNAGAPRLQLNPTGTLINATGDVICDDAAKGFVLKDTQATPHYWRITVDNTGNLVVTDIGTTMPF